MRQQRYHGGRKGLSAFFLAAATAVVARRWWRTRRPFRMAVEGTSMAPTLAPGDFLVATAPRTLVRGSVVVVAHPSRPGLELVKRLIAVPGDRTIDGRVLGHDQYWVQGEEAAASTDSRSFGPVSGASIRGVVRLRYWPPGRAGPVR